MRDMIVYGNTRADLGRVQPGGTFFLNGLWDCSVEGPIYMDKPIHVIGNGGMKMRGYSGVEQFGDGSRIKNNHPTAEEAIYFDIPQENQAQGLRVSRIGIMHAAKASSAIRLRNAPAACLEHIYVDCRYGHGGLFYDEGCFFMEARHVVIRDFSGVGVNIAGNGNGYSFYDCTIASKRQNYNIPNTAQSAVHCINSGLQIIGGYYEAQNDDYSGVGIRLFYDVIRRPACTGDALIYWPYTENGDIAIQIDASQGHHWDKASIIRPHWSLRQHKKFTRGVEVVRGMNIVIDSPQIADWDEVDSNAIVFRENASNCLFTDKIRNLSGCYTDLGVDNRIESNA